MEFNGKLIKDKVPKEKITSTNENSVLLNNTIKVKDVERKQTKKPVGKKREASLTRLSLNKDLVEKLRIKV